MKKVLCFLVCALLFNSMNSIAQVNLQLGLIAYYPMNNSPLDSTSSNLDLTPFGSPVGTTDRFGALPGAYSLNALVPDYFTSALDPLLAPAEVTVAAWVNLTDAFRDQKIAGRAEVNAGGYLLGVDSNKIDAEIWDMTGAHFRLKVKMVSSAVWTHLAMSYKANDYFRVYIDGVVMDSIPAGVYSVGTTNFWTFTVGGAPWQPTALNPTGSIDDLYVYNRALNNEEVDALFNLVTTNINGVDTYRINSIYPVPLHGDNLSIDFKNTKTGIVELIITDPSGKIVFSKKLNNPQKEIFDLSHLSNGVYSVLLIDGDKRESHQVVISK